MKRILQSHRRIVEIPPDLETHERPDLASLVEC